MIDAGDRVGIPSLTVRRFAYLNSQKWIHFGLLETLSISIFFVGNLGTRMVALAGFNRKYLDNKIQLRYKHFTPTPKIIPF